MGAFGRVLAGRPLAAQIANDVRCGSSIVVLGMSTAGIKHPFIVRRINSIVFELHCN